MSTVKIIFILILAVFLGIGIGYLWGKDNSPAPIIIEKSGNR